MLLVVGPRIGFRIFQHGLEGEVVVDALDALDEGIGNDYLSVRTALGSSVAVAAAGIGHIALALIDIQQRVHDIRLTLLVDERDER